MIDLPDALPLALAGTSFVPGARHGLDRDHLAPVTDLTSPRQGDEEHPRRHARRGTGLASLVLGALILTGYSGIVPPIVES